MTERQNAFSDKQAKLVIIGLGEATHLSEFRKVTGYRGELLTDPSRESYRLLEFTSDILGVMGLKPITHAFTSMLAGFTPGMIHGNVFQLGGAVIVKPDGTVPYYYASSEAGDHPPVDELLAALP